MANVGSIALQVVANIAQFTSGLKTAKSKLGAFGRDVKYMARSIMPALGAGAALYGLKKTIDGLDQLNKDARKLGVATAELDALRYTTEKLGLASTVADDALKFMGRSIGEARLKGGELAAAFKSLGIPLEKLEQMGKAAALQATIDQLGRIKSEYDRASLAQQIFGRGGQELLALVRVGGDGLRQLAEEAKKYNRALSETDAKKAEAAAEAMERMGHALSGLGRAISIAVSPIVEKMFGTAEAIINFLHGGFHGVRMMIAAVQEYSFKTLAWISDKVLWLFKKVRKFADWVPVLGKATKGLRDGIEEGGQWLTDYWAQSGEDAADGFWEAFNDASKPLIRARDSWMRTWGADGGKAVGSALKNSLSGLGLDAKKQTADKTASALQVESFARIARGVPGVSRDKEISWPAGESVLRAIERNTAKPVAVAG